MFSFGDLWNTLIYLPLLNLLILFYKISFQNLGLAIVGITLFIKIITYPMNKSSVELAAKQRELKPKIDELKAKYTDKQVFAQKQMELFKEHGINPVSGCLPQLFTIIFVIAPLYSVFSNLLSNKEGLFDKLNTLTYNWDFLKFSIGETLNTYFLFFDLAQPNYYLPVLAAAAQFYLSRLMTPSTKKMEKVAKDTPDKADDIMYNMQEQMLYTMPILTFVIGIGLPSGLVWYWFISTVLTALQYLIQNRSIKNKNGRHIETSIKN